jgi:hypothetical protein
VHAYARARARELLARTEERKTSSGREEDESLAAALCDLAAATLRARIGEPRGLHKSFRACSGTESGRPAGHDEDDRMHCRKCYTTRDLVAIVPTDKRRPVCRVCADCRAKELACVECGARSPTMFEIRYSKPSFARIEEERIARGEIEPRRICPDCAERMRTDVDAELGRPVLSTGAAKPVASTSSSPGVFATPAPKRDGVFGSKPRTKAPRRSSGDGVFRKVKS